MNIFPIEIESDWAERFLVDRSDLYEKYPDAPGYYPGLRLMGEAARDLESTALRLVIDELKEFPEIMDGGSHFILSPEPYTILDPFSIPPDPIYSPGCTPDEWHARVEADQAALEPWGDAADTVRLFADEFEREGMLERGQPFTILGYWDEPGNSGSVFGYNPASLNPKLVVLFC